MHNRNRQPGRKTVHSASSRSNRVNFEHSGKVQDHPDIADVSRATRQVRRPFRSHERSRRFEFADEPDGDRHRPIFSGGVIGPSTFDGSVKYSNKHGAIKYTKGVATLANWFGDSVNVAFSGKGHLAGTNFVFSVKGSVKGGTGRTRRRRVRFPATAVRVP